MLEVKDLHAYYGKSHVLRGMHLTVGDGEIVSLLGRNGVGRSTTVKAVMGQVTARGSVKFKGEELVGLKAHEIALRGVGYVPEDRAIFPDLTVHQNLLLGQKGRKESGRWRIEDAYQLFPQLRERADAPGGVLSGGEQQMLTLCRTMMGDPDFVMIDEPTEGLAPKVVDLVANFLVEVKKRGASVLLVEQKLAIALDISDHLFLMGHGRVVFDGTPQDLRDNEAVRKEWMELRQ